MGTMDLLQLLRETRTEILEQALRSLSRSGLPHYSAAAEESNRRRLSDLYDVTMQCVVRRTLAPIEAHARFIARERFRDGFGLREVHTAFNVLEEELWHAVTVFLLPHQYSEALGLVSSVLGAGKQALAVEYVELADPTARVAALDVAALFRGTA